MSSKKVLVVQSAADTFTTTQISTGLTSDGKSGWEITALEAFWSNGESVAAADYEINAVLATISTATNFDDIDEIARISWGLQNTGGVAVAVPYDPVKEKLLIEPRLTVQPILFLGVISSATAQANSVRIAVTYNIVKLTDLEVLRLLQGGA